MTRTQLVEEIRALGLGAGDLVMLHSSLASIGHVDGGAGGLVEAFLEVLGPEGVLAAPTFGGGEEVFDAAKSPSGLGAVTTAVMKHPSAARSRHPMASVAAIGGRAEEIVRDHEQAPTAHAEGTPYTRIAELGGYVVLLGVDQDRNTTLHTAEALCRLPYLSTRSKGYIDGNGVEQTGTWDYFPGPHRDFIGLDRRLRDRGVVRLGKVGRAVARVMKSAELIDAVVEMIKADPAAVLCDNPSCTDCVGQRADLRRAEIESESFRLVASSRFAGGDIEEIIANLKAAGVNALEVDTIGGRDAARMKEGDLEALSDRLSAAGIAVASVASARWSAGFDLVLAACARLGASRAVLPLQAGLEPQIAEASARGVGVFLRNGAVTGSRAAEIMAAYPEEATLSFDPAGFLLAGEDPFSGAHHSKARRRIGQLVVADAARDGTPTGLARGSCEIKELVSILRCRSFDGDMVLRAPPGQGPPGFRSAAAEFLDLLGGL